MPGPSPVPRHRRPRPTRHGRDLQRRGGPFSVSLHVTDKGGECTAATNVTVQQGGTNNPPVANDDSYNATDGQTLSVGHPGVLANDTDEDPNTLTAVLNASTTKGALNLNADGSFTYNYNGGAAPDTDSFTYHAVDDASQSSASPPSRSISRQAVSRAAPRSGAATPTPRRWALR